MFEKFDEEARQVIVLAQGEARQLRHGVIGTEHLLLGLLHGGIPRDVLAPAVTLEQARERVEAITGRGDTRPVTGQIPFTPRAKKVLEDGLREALRLGHNTISPEHILLGLVRSGDSVGWRLLNDAGMTPDGVRAAVHDLLMRRPAPKRTVEWPAELERAVSAYLEETEKVIDLLDRDAIPLLELRTALDDAATVAEIARDAVAALVLPRRRSPEGG